MTRKNTRRTTIYDIPTYREMLNLSQRADDYTEDHKKAIAKCLCDINDADLTDELFDMIRRMPNSQNRASLLQIAKQQTDTYATDPPGDEGTRLTTAFAIIMTISTKDQASANAVDNHCTPLKHFSSVNIANLLHRSAMLDTGTRISINPTLYSTQMLHNITNHHWKKTIRYFLERTGEAEGEFQIPITSVPHTKVLTTKGPDSAYTNKALIGLIQYRRQADFDRFFIKMTSTTAWTQPIQQEVLSALRMDTAGNDVSIFPLIYPARAALNEMANLDRVITAKDASQQSTTTHVFYTYSQWKKKNSRALHGQTAEEHASGFTRFIEDWHGSISQAISASKKTQILLADVDTMSEYMAILQMNPDDQQSWQEAEAVIESIKEPLIEILSESRHPGQLQQQPHASVSPHALPDGTIIYLVVTVSEPDNPNVAQYIIWNTHTHTAEEAKEALATLLTQWGVQEIHHYPPSPVAICPCCNEILAVQYDPSQKKPL